MARLCKKDETNTIQRLCEEENKHTQNKYLFSLIISLDMALSVCLILWTLEPLKTVFFCTLLALSVPP